MSLVRTAVAFMRREILEELSYPLKGVLGLLALLASLGVLTLFSDFAGRAMMERFGGKEGGYLAFALVGLGFHSLIDTALRELSGRIRAAQIQGSFEALLATRAPLAHVMICLPLYPLLRAVLRVGLVFVLAEWLLDVDFAWANAALALMVFALTMLVFAAFGLLFAALTVVFKRTEPLVMLFNAACFFLGGVLIPWQELPPVLQWVSAGLPMTPALDAFRAAAIDGGDWSEVWPACAHLVGFAAVLVPGSCLVFRWAIRRALRDGSLGQF